MMMMMMMMMMTMMITTTTTTTTVIINHSVYDPCCFTECKNVKERQHSSSYMTTIEPSQPTLASL